jgi:hypothetical protein
VSSPIENVGSLPPLAAGRSISVISSRVMPFATCRRAMSSGTSTVGSPGETVVRNSASHAPYGRCAAMRATGSSWRPPSSGSTMIISPGPRRARRTFPSSGTVPTSLPHAIIVSFTW